MCGCSQLSQMLTAHSSEPLTSAIGGALDLKQLNNRRLESKAAIFKRELGLGLDSSHQSSFCLLSIQEKLPVSVQNLPQTGGDCSLLLIFISIPCYLIKACAI